MYFIFIYYLFYVFIYLLQIREVSKVTKSLLDDINGYQSLAKDIKEILDDFQSYNKEKFDNWSQELLDGLRTRSLGYFFFLSVCTHLLL